MFISTGKPLIYTPTQGSRYIYEKDYRYFKEYRKAKFAFRTTWRNDEFIDDLYKPNREIEAGENLIVKVDKIDDGVHCVTPLGWINHRPLITITFYQAGPIYIVAENDAAALSLLLHINGNNG